MRVTVHQAKTQLSQLLKRAAAGEEVIILHRDRPVAKVIPYGPQRAADLRGDLAGKVTIADDFDATPNDFKDYT